MVVPRHYSAAGAWGERGIKKLEQSHSQEGITKERIFPLNWCNNALSETNIAGVGNEVDSFEIILPITVNHSLEMKFETVGFENWRFTPGKCTEYNPAN